MFQRKTYVGRDSKGREIIIPTRRHDLNEDGTRIEDPNLSGSFTARCNQLFRSIKYYGVKNDG